MVSWLVGCLADTEIAVQVEGKRPFALDWPAAGGSDRHCCEMTAASAEEHSPNVQYIERKEKE